MLELAAERGGHPDDPLKDDPLDFVLWQRSAEGEPWWDSPWGRGRPGWHIECSTMARRLIGQPVDIHGGGSDLVFPHHESEIAQAEGLPGGRPFVRHWVHTGEVQQAGEKMSKSLGNMTFVPRLLERYPPRSVRAYLLSKHYRETWVFSEEDLARFNRNPEASGGGREAFFAALDDDLDTPVALRVLQGAIAAHEPWVDEGAEVLGLRGL
jgi:L-cysteine:1D-myo-inositol 2-amino-2-deoxy-alpha-D-glucopyranoside ligase